MQMRLMLLAAGAAFALSGGAALAAGNPAIANQTTTSMGAPNASPSYQAPRSESVPGLSQQQRTAQEQNEAMKGQTDQGVAAPVQGPKTLSGHTQTAR